MTVREGLFCTYVHDYISCTTAYEFGLWFVLKIILQKTLIFSQSLKWFGPIALFVRFMHGFTCVMHFLPGKLFLKNIMGIYIRTMTHYVYSQARPRFY
jgi:uncharacterized membrane protein